jgi:hypothetical protein
MDNTKDQNITEVPADRDEIVDARTDYLGTLGFDQDAIEKMIARQPTLFKGVRPEQTISFLRSLGFEDPLRLIKTFPGYVHITEEGIRTRIATLKDVGFEDPIKMLTTTPPLISYSEEMIRRKVEFYRQLGVEDPIKMITRHPGLLGYAEESVRTRIELFKELGFEHPVKIIATHPTLLGASDTKLRGRMALLAELGFAKPVKIATSMPTILGLAEGSLRAKMDLLKKMGFNDPAKLITSAPIIFTLSEEHLEARFNLLRRAIDLYGVDIDVVSLMEKLSGIWSTKKEKLLVHIRILKEYKVNEDELTNATIGKLLTANLEDLLTAFTTGRQPGETISDLLERTRRVKGMHHEKTEQQRALLEGGLASTGADPAIESTYRRGYGEKLK